MYTDISLIDISERMSCMANFLSALCLLLLFFTGSITPTVELNGLAMKRGEPAIYRPLDPKPLPNYRANYNFRGMYNQRFVWFLLFALLSPPFISPLSQHYSWDNLYHNISIPQTSKARQEHPQTHCCSWWATSWPRSSVAAGMQCHMPANQCSLSAVP